MRMVSWIGMVAMLMVGGGILIHNLSFLNEYKHIGGLLPLILPILVEYFATPIVIALIIGVFLLIIKSLIINNYAFNNKN